MTLQQRILKLYRQIYPTHTLRETSELTGIQLTRVFRLLNGAPMKLEEFERFQEALSQHGRIDLHQGALQRAIVVARQVLSESELNKLTELIDKHIRWHQMIHGHSNEQSQQILA